MQKKPLSRSIVSSHVSLLISNTIGSNYEKKLACDPFSFRDPTLFLGITSF